MGGIVLLTYLNCQKPVAALVRFNPHDDLELLLPRSPKTQKAWSKRALKNKVRSIAEKN